MQMFYGSGFFGSPLSSTTIANDELIAKHMPVGVIAPSIYKVKFMPLVDCTITINGGSPMGAKGLVEFSSDFVDVQVRSFVVSEVSIGYYFNCAYQ